MWKNFSGLCSGLSRERKKTLTITGLTLWMFLVGVEYSVILPTGWFYLKTFPGVDYWYFGIVLSMFSLTCAIFSPLLGLILDKTYKMKLLTFGATLFEVLGNIIYSLRYSKYIPLVGRGLCGLGSALLGPIYGELGRITTPEERTKYFALIQGARIFGIIIGPCFNLGLEKISVHIGGLLVDFTNVPGFFMALVWIILAFANLLMVFDLSVPAQSQHVYTKVSNIDEDEKGIANEDKEKKVAFEIEEPPSSDSTNIPTFLEGVRQTCKKELLVLIWIQVFTAFFIMSMDAFAPLFTKDVLGWKVTYINIGYLVIGVVLLIASIVVGLLSKHISNKKFLLGSNILLLIGNSFVIGIPFVDDVASKTGLYLTFVFFLSVLVPLNLICGRTLLSHVTPDHVQGFVQGVLVFWVSISHIIGPVFGTYMFDKLLALSLTMNALNIGTIVLLLLIYKNLEIVSEK